MAYNSRSYCLWMNNKIGFVQCIQKKSKGKDSTNLTLLNKNI